MNLRTPPYFILLFAMLMIAACADSPQDDDMIIPQDGGSLSATIDGETFSVSGLQVTADHNTVNTVTHTLTVGGAKLPIGGVTKSLVLAAVLTNSATGMASGESYTASDPDRVAAGEYVIDDNGVKIKALSSNTGEATITITSIDFDQKLVSGTFSFDASDDDDPNTVYKIRNGEFKDVPFD